MTDRIERWRQRRGWLIAIGAAGCALAVAYTTYGMATLRLGTLSRPGAGIFPIAVGAILLLTGAMLVAHARTIPASERVDVPEGASRVRALTLIGLFIAYAVLLPTLGFITSTFAFLLLASRSIGGASWLRCAVLAAAVSAGAFWLFANQLHVSLPRDAFLDLL